MDPKQALIDEIVAETEETEPWTGRRVLSPRVLAAIGKVAREMFVPPAEADLAYVNAPLPIGHGQTISQPFIVAIMTELLDLAPGAKVLEVGTGSGYQAAVLAELGARVFSIEGIPALAEGARANLARAGYGQVGVRAGDGYLGWPEEAPFDAVIVTAAAHDVPPPLVEQLKPGGRMVIPVNVNAGGQVLLVLDKDADGAVKKRATLPVAFVPLVRVQPASKRP